MEQILEWDRELFFFLNGLHTPWLDSIMWYISNKFVWIPLYVFLVFVIFKFFGRQGWWWLIGLALAIICSDQLTSSIMKPFFARWRPSRDPSIEEGLVYILRGYRGGSFGFASSHAANAFAVATYIFLILRKYVTWAWLLFIFASIISYSRIYLGVHYPGDLFVGAVLGSLLAWLFYILIKWYLKLRPGIPEG